MFKLSDGTRNLNCTWWGLSKDDEFDGGSVFKQDGRRASLHIDARLNSDELRELADLLDSIKDSD